MRQIISRHFNLITGLLARRYFHLLIALILMIFIPGFLEHTKFQNLASFIFRSAVVLIGILVLQESKKQLRFGLIAGILVLLVNQLGVFSDSTRIDFYLSFIIFIVFYGFLAISILNKIRRTERVTEGVLYAAIIVYLLIGVIGGFSFMLIENLVPGSINNLTVENLKDPSKFIYFSFTTLSTLGYGDITPANSAAQSLSIILSTLGPLYLTILVALLVSRFDSHKHSHKS